MPRKLTGFERMWNAYPVPGGSAEEAKEVIGGGALTPWMLNTCVIRISRAMNYAGHPIPAGFPGLSTVRGADGMRYAFRVEELRRYMNYSYGPPALVENRDPPRDEVPEKIKGQIGIIAFLVKGWADATGHVDLWDGEGCRHTNYFAKAHQILLWRVAPTGEAKLAPGTSPVPISASVGKDGKNKQEDVARVQALLDARGVFEVGPSDGFAGPCTLQAIEDFQKRFLKEPDGRVDPNGRTWRELNGL
jgi:hypothetical protein